MLTRLFVRLSERRGRDRTTRSRRLLLVLLMAFVTYHPAWATGSAKY